MRLIILGAPAAGKGTQASRLSQQLNIPHISSGDIFRENIRLQTELGKQAKEYIDKGQLVPDNITINMVLNTISEKTNGGFLLDGFPRTIVQAESLEAELAKQGKPINKVLDIEVSDDIIIERMVGRRVCSNCQATYHTKFNPPKIENVCDVCQGPLIQRNDDKEEIVRKRLEVYHSQTQPLINYYDKKGLLIKISGEGLVDEVTSRMFKALEI